MKRLLLLLLVAPDLHAGVNANVDPEPCKLYLHAYN